MRKARPTTTCNCDRDAEISVRKIRVNKLPTQASLGSEKGSPTSRTIVVFSSASDDDTACTDALDSGRGGDGKDVNAPGDKKYIASHLHDSGACVVGHCDDAESVSTYNVFSDCWDSDTPSDM